MNDISRTAEGANQYHHTMNHALEFFSKAGSMRTRTHKSFYEEQLESILDLFIRMWIVDKSTSMRLLFWLRDCRGGAGNRSGFRTCLSWLAKNDPSWVEANLNLIPEVGRWDDLRVLFDSPVSHSATVLWGNAIKDNNGLAAKWAKREDKKLQYFFLMSIGDFRRYLANQRKLYSNLVESKMCAKEWNRINYSNVPSIAMARYTNTFNEHDISRFSEFKLQVKNGEVKINSSGVLFPHDCVITALYGDNEIADLQFNSLPNFMKQNEKIICLCDSSDSMQDKVGGSNKLEAIHVSMGLSLYCSDKVGKDNPFYRKFIGFESESTFKDWTKLSFSEAIHNYDIFDGAVGSTRIDKALDLILNTAKFFNLNKDQMPTMLLIISDMQFSRGVMNTNETPVENCIRGWVEAGYDPPKIVYWGLTGLAGSPATMNHRVGLVSGFSPSILKAVFSDDFTPIGIMKKAIEKYHINIPQ